MGETQSFHWYVACCEHSDMHVNGQKGKSSMGTLHANEPCYLQGGPWGATIGTLTETAGGCFGGYHVSGRFTGEAKQKRSHRAGLVLSHMGVAQN